MTALFCALWLGLAQANDVTTVKEKLYQAKKEYDSEVRKFRKSVAEWLEKREDAARKAGDKKQLDRVKIERKQFDETGELPAELPTSARRQVLTARLALDKAYQTAVSEYIRLKEDAAAEAIEKERERFLFNSAFVVNKRTYLASLKPTEITAWKNWFEKDTDKSKMGENIIPHSLFLHPDSKGIASVNYTLPAKAFAFRASVGVPKNEEKLGEPSSPLTFEVLGEGKSLWKSEPVARREMFQTCELKVEKLKTLTLRVHCPQGNGGAHAVWFAPFVVE